MIGRSLAHYTITGLLGTGGMGEVYRARDTRLDRDVALKVLPPRMADDPVRLSRFKREARTVASLNHPNIVTLYSVDEEDGTHFLTMELVEGRSLHELMPSGGIPVDRLLDLAAPMADALACAHAQGIIHRDLKPGNVMVSDETGRLKVLDFGLAKLNMAPETADSGQLDTLTVTRNGGVLGTPYYMSPEQARGEDVDHRTDIFSLGVMLFEMATGRRPFQGGSTIELLSSVLRDPPPPLAEVSSGLPVQLEALINRCLEKAPEDRYQTAAEVHTALQALRQEIPAGSRFDPLARTVTQVNPAGATLAGTGEATQPRRKFGRVPLLAAVMVIAVVLAAAWLGSRPSPAPSDSERRVVAVLPFENLGSPDEEYFAAGITDEITSRLALIRDLGIISRTSTRVYTGTGKSIRQIGEELGTDYILEGTIRWERTSGHGRVRISPRLIQVANDTQIWTETYERELTEIFALQAEIATRIAKALDVTLAARDQKALESSPTANMEAYQAYLQGMKQLVAPGFSRESFTLGQRMFQRAVELDPDFALAYARLASMNARMYHYGFDRSAQRLQAAKSAADQALQLRPELAEAYLALGHYFYWGTRDYARALEALEEARLHAPSMSEVLLTTAYVKRRQGDFNAAVGLLEQYRTLSPLDPNAFVGLGETYSTLRRYAEAESAYRRALVLQPGDTYPYTELGLLYLRWRGDTAAARAILDQAPAPGGSEVIRVGFLVDLFAGRYDAALQLLESHPGPVLEAGAFYIPVELEKGMVLRLQGKPDQARAAFAAARTHLEQRLQDTPGDPRLHSALGLTLAGLGEEEAAVTHGQKAVELYPLAKDALEAPVQVINLAMINTMVGRNEEALSELDTVLSIPSILSTVWLENDPRWSRLLDSAEFQSLLEKHATEPGI